MTENQQVKNLQFFRNKIDNIDDQIIALLEERMRVVLGVAEFKTDNHDKFFIKSAREADMIKNLTQKISGNFSPAIISAIWRKIITNSNMREQPIQVAIFNPKNVSDYKYLLREYYSEIVPAIEFKEFNAVALDIEKNKSQIAAFAVSEGSKNWWIDLARSDVAINIFAKIPFVKIEGQVEMFLAAIKESEKSESDNSLLAVELKNKSLEAEFLKALKDCYPAAIILQSTVNIDSEKYSYLFQLENFYLESDEKFTTLKAKNLTSLIKIIGHFPSQISL